MNSMSTSVMYIIIVACNSLSNNWSQVLHKKGFLSIKYNKKFHNIPIRVFTKT